MDSSSARDSYSTLKSFTTNFVSDDFFIDVIRTVLYPSEIGFISVGQSNGAIDYIRTFFIDLGKTCEKIKVTNIKSLKKNINMVVTILNIRESGSSIINYQNVFNHLSSIEFSQNVLIQKAINAQFTDSTEFRKSVNQIINSIQAYFEVCNISSSIIEFDQFSEYATSPGVSVFEAIKMYKEKVILLYNQLAQLRTLDKYETEKDYFVIGKTDSTAALAKSLVDYISNGYSFFKTGYKIFDDNIDGFESSSVHIVSAPLTFMMAAF